MKDFPLVFSKINIQIQPGFLVMFVLKTFMVLYIQISKIFKHKCSPEKTEVILLFIVLKLYETQNTPRDLNEHAEKA